MQWTFSRPNQWTFLCVVIQNAPWCYAAQGNRKIEHRFRSCDCFISYTTIFSNVKSSAELVCCFKCFNADCAYFAEVDFVFVEAEAYYTRSYLCCVHSTFMDCAPLSFPGRKSSDRISRVKSLLLSPAAASNWAVSEDIKIAAVVCHSFKAASCPLSGHANGSCRIAPALFKSGWGQQEHNLNYSKRSIKKIAQGPSFENTWSVDV